jgi:hypothetical protein
MKFPRFSLRTLLILTACLAALCYWRDRPRRLARQFANAINARDFTAANQLFSDPLQQLPDKMGPRIWRGVCVPQSASDWIRGECFLNMVLPLDGQKISVPLVAESNGVKYLGGFSFVPGGKRQPVATSEERTPSPVWTARR